MATNISATAFSNLLDLNANTRALLTRAADALSAQGLAPYAEAFAKAADVIDANATLCRVYRDAYEASLRTTTAKPTAQGAR